MAMLSRWAELAAHVERWGRLDFLVHAIAYADKEELKSIATSHSSAATARLCSRPHLA